MRSRISSLPALVLSKPLNRRAFFFLKQLLCHSPNRHERSDTICRSPNLSELFPVSFPDSSGVRMLGDQIRQRLTYLPSADANLLPARYTLSYVEQHSLRHLLPTQDKTAQADHAIGERGEQNGGKSNTSFPEQFGMRPDWLLQIFPWLCNAAYAPSQPGKNVRTPMVWIADRRPIRFDIYTYATGNIVITPCKSRKLYGKCRSFLPIFQRSLLFPSLNTKRISLRKMYQPFAVFYMGTFLPLPTETGKQRYPPYPFPATPLYRPPKNIHPRKNIYRTDNLRIPFRTGMQSIRIHTLFARQGAGKKSGTTQRCP